MARESSSWILSFDLVPRGSSSVTGTGLVVAQIVVTDVDGLRPPASLRTYFSRDRATLTPISLEDYADVVEASMVGEATYRGGIIVRPGAVELQGLSPWDNPECAHEVEEFLRENSRELGTTRAALENEAPMAGCAAGNEGGTLTFSLLLVLLVSAALWRASRRLGGAILVVFAVAVPLITPAVASAESRMVYGYLSFWDTRDGQHNETGTRAPVCTTSIKSCNPGTTGCCFTGIPRVKVSLRKDVAGPDETVDTVQTNANGWYYLIDDDWSNVTYYLDVCYTREGYPGAMSLRGYGDVKEICFELPAQGFELTNTATYLGNVSVNQADDTTSPMGDAASHWATAHDVFSALEAEGETRHRMRYGSTNAYDAYDAVHDIYHAAGWGLNCSNSYASSASSDARSRYLGAFAYGTLYQCRVVGDSFTAPYFPSTVGFENVWSEANALHEAIANTVANLIRWDPEISTTPTLNGSCFSTTGLGNTNDVAITVNVEHAIWELLDDSTAGADAYADYANLTMADLADGLEEWQDSTCQLMQNRSRCELYYSSSSTPCNSNEECSAGDVCFMDDHYCRSGDPHGNNIRDWLYHISAVVSLTENQLWQTMVSSACVNFSGQGGYRVD